MKITKGIFIAQDIDEYGKHYRYYTSKKYYEQSLYKWIASIIRQKATGRYSITFALPYGSFRMIPPSYSTSTLQEAEQLIQERFRIYLWK